MPPKSPGRATWCSFRRPAPVSICLPAMATGAVNLKKRCSRLQSAELTWECPRIEGRSSTNGYPPASDRRRDRRASFSGRGRSPGISAADAGDARSCLSARGGKLIRKVLRSMVLPSENIRCYGLKGKNPLELLKAITLPAGVFFSGAPDHPPLSAGSDPRCRRICHRTGYGCGKDTWAFRRSSMNKTRCRAWRTENSALLSTGCVCPCPAARRFSGGKDRLHRQSGAKGNSWSSPKNRPPRREQQEDPAGAGRQSGGAGGQQAGGRGFAELAGGGAGDGLRVIHQTGERDAAYGPRTI